jgi:2,3-bisphosphoglycerate-independent phosphoglycerate mutase
VTRKTLLIVMDGWGWREEDDGNAVRQANTPTFDELWSTYPHTLISCSGPDVGLPQGQMGNSEVGHLNLGAGRVVYQDIVRIDRAIADGSISKNEVLTAAMDAAAKAPKGGAFHLIGLLSDGGVHSHQEHLYALVRMAKERGLDRVFVHAILDGRDTPPHNGIKYLTELDDKLREIGVGKLASIVGRYYCMDRDKRWERTKRAYDLLTLGEGERSSDFKEAMKHSYERDVTDEFVEPIVIVDGGDPAGLVSDGDSVLFFNFRSDRAREITTAFTGDDFDGFERTVRPRIHYACLAEYDETFGLPVVFPPETYENILADLLSAAGKKSMRIAETEKYAHVTYFFNGGVEKEFESEKRILIPSPKVATYDLQPEMSADQVCSTLIGEIESDRHDCIVCNFANPDMVGHTGVFEAAVKAVETVDTCVGRIIDALDLDRYVAIVTADHGNSEEMIDYVNGGPFTAHTTNLVPCILVDPDYKGRLIEGGALKDIAPTMCNYLEITVPEEMTGEDLRAEIQVGRG